MTASTTTSIWNRFRAQPVHVLCWAVFFAVLGWAAQRSFPTDFDPEGASSNERGSDFIYYYKGAEGVWNGTDPYARFTFGARVDHAYNYPPMVAIVLSPLAELGVTGAAQVWFVINIALVAGLFLAWWAVIARRFDLPTDLLSSGAVLSVAVLCGIEVVRREIDDLQTDTILLAALLILATQMDRRAWLAGLALAVGIHVKFLLLVFLPFLLVTKRFRPLAWSIGFVVLIFFATALVSGWDENQRHYAMSLGGAARIVGISSSEVDLAGRVHDLTWHNSVSLPSAVARITAGGATKSLTDTPPEYSHGLVYGITLLLALLCGGLGWGIYRLNRVPLIAAFWTKAAAYDPVTRSRMALLEVAMGAVALLAFSPQTMKRHMFLALPILILGSALVLLRRRGAPIWTPAAGLAIITAGMMLPPGGSSTKHLVEDWKWISGVSICLLIGSFLILHAALRTHRAIRDGKPIADPPPPRVPWFGKKKASG